MNAFTQDLDSWNRIVFAIGQYRFLPENQPVTYPPLRDYLKLNLSIQDWIMWQRLSAGLRKEK